MDDDTIIAIWGICLFVIVIICSFYMMWVRYTVRKYDKAIQNYKKELRKIEVYESLKEKMRNERIAKQNGKL